MENFRHHRETGCLRMVCNNSDRKPHQLQMHSLQSKLKVNLGTYTLSKKIEIEFNNGTIDQKLELYIYTCTVLTPSSKYARLN